MLPHCHPIPIEGCSVDWALEEGALRCTVSVRTHWTTGVEMEALTAVSVAALTIYDMCKAVDRGMEIRNVGLLEKRGGKSASIEGADGMRDASIGPRGDGVIRINGAELMRLGPGARPCAKQDFDLDISSYAGTEVMLEFVSDGHHRTANADWFEPRIVVQ